MWILDSVVVASGFSIGRFCVRAPAGSDKRFACRTSIQGFPAIGAWHSGIACRGAMVVVIVKQSATAAHAVGLIYVLYEISHFGRKSLDSS